MEEEKWREVKRIFSAAVELCVAERNQLLTEECGDEEIRREVENLLSADIEAETLPDIFGAKSLTKPQIEKNIGKYKILRELGVGGMGTVFLAVREDLKKEVALKIVKYEFASKDLLRRFENEREILAALEHPNIARLLDIGTTETGLPFFVMEYVEGADLLTFCRENNLSLAAKLNLFRQVCAAVAYAHGKLVVHRDLKPTNILVTKDGIPKLLDFGISKLLNENAPPEQKGTATAFGMMTPNYASPEQFRGESVSTATDIYSLGVILYELLTNNLPYDVENRRLDEVARAVCETNPQKPSEIISGKWNLAVKTADGDDKRTNGGDKTNPKSKTQNPRLLRGDIDNIILKSLRKEPERRYSSVEKFSDDLRRHLDGLPVTARPDTFSYRAEKFIKRNRSAVAAGALVFLILIGGIVGVSWQYVRAERQRVLAEKRFGQVRQIANNVVFKYYDEIKNLEGATKAREMIITDATAYLDGLAQESADNDALQIELSKAYMRVGDIQGEAFAANTGDTKSSIENYDKAIKLLEPIALASNDLPTKDELLDAYLKLEAVLRRDYGERAQEFAVKAMNLSEKIVTANPDDVRETVRLARCRIAVTDNLKTYAEKNDGYRRALAIVEPLLQTNPTNASVIRMNGNALSRIAVNYYLQGFYNNEAENVETAQNLYNEAMPFNSSNLELYEKLLALEPANIKYQRAVLIAKLNKAANLREVGQTDEATNILKQLLAESAEITAADPKNLNAQSDMAEVQSELANTYARRQEFPAAFENFRQSLAVRDAAVARDPQNAENIQIRFMTDVQYADALVNSGDAAAAVKEYQNANAKLADTKVFDNKPYSRFAAGFMYLKIGNSYLAKPAQSAENRQNACRFYQTAVENWSSNNIPLEIAEESYRALSDYANAKFNGCSERAKADF